jgi:hypothetical protein
MAGLECRSDAIVESVTDRLELIAALKIQSCICVELLGLFAYGSNLRRRAVDDFAKSLEVHGFSPKVFSPLS